MSFDSYKAKIRDQLSEPYDVWSETYHGYISILKGSLDSEPNNLNTLNQLAIAYMETREPETALDIFRQAVNVKATIQALNNLAYFYLYEGEPTDEGCWREQEEKAIEILKQAISMKPKSFLPYILLGEAYIRTGQFANAEAILTDSLLISKTTESLNNLGVCLYNLGKIPDAAVYFYQAHANRNEDNFTLRPLYHYGICLGQQGLGSEACAVADKLMSELGDSSDLDEDFIAEIYFLSGHYDKVTRIYSKTNLAYSPDWVSLFFFSLHELGHSQELKFAFKQVIDSKKEQIQDAIEDDSWEISDRNQYVVELQAKINEYNRLYVDITTKSLKPELRFEPSIERRCSLFGCIRHDIPDYDECRR